MGACWLGVLVWLVWLAGSISRSGRFVGKEANSDYLFYALLFSMHVSLEHFYILKVTYVLFLCPGVVCPADQVQVET